MGKGALFQALQNDVALADATLGTRVMELVGLQDSVVYRLAEEVFVGPGLAVVFGGFLDDDFLGVCVDCGIVENFTVGPGGFVYGHGFEPFATR